MPEPWPTPTKCPHCDCLVWSIEQHRRWIHRADA